MNSRIGSLNEQLNEIEPVELVGSDTAPVITDVEQVSELEVIDSSVFEEVPDPGPFARSLRDEVRILERGEHKEDSIYSDKVTPYAKLPKVP